MGLISSSRPVIRNLARRAAYRLSNRHVYRLCTFYVNAVDNNFDCDWNTNGEAAFARAVLPKCRVAFDIGAAAGEWTAIALAANPRLVVHCFEPTSRRFAILSGQGFGPNVVLNQLGLGDSVESKTIFYGTSGGSNSLIPQETVGEDQESVQLSTLDLYCEQHQIETVDFVKMDIEGYEMNAMRGAQKMLREGRIGALQFEYGEVYIEAGITLRQVMEFVRSLNSDYEFYKLYPDGPRHVPAYTPQLENFKTQNWAIMKRGFADSGR